MSWSDRILQRIVPPGFRDTVYGDLIEERARARAAGKRGPTVWLPISILRLWGELLGARLAAKVKALRSKSSADGPEPPRSRHRIDNVAHDLKLACRSIRRSPVLAAAIVLTLATAIGATTAMYSLLEAALLRPLPYPRAGEVVLVWPVRNDRGPGELSVANAEVFDVRNGVPSLAEVGAIGYGEVTLDGLTSPERVRVGRVSAQIFSLLRVAPDHGRTFTAREDAPGGEPVVVLSQDLWARRFGADPAVLGSGVRLGDDVYTVIGVMPAGFRLPTDYGSATPSQLWTPLRLNPVDPGFRGSKDLAAIVGRVSSTATRRRVQSELDRVAAVTRRDHADSYPSDQGWTLVVRDVLEQSTGPFRPLLVLLMSAVSLLLAIACTNVAHLLLGRVGERRADAAIRLALGAGRARLILQYLTESILLAGAAAAIGVLMAVAAIGVLRARLPADFPRLEDVGINGHVLTFAVAVAGVTAVACGLVPALAATRVELRQSFRGGAAGGRRGAVGGALVIGEVAMAVVLLIGGGLLLRTLVAYVGTDPGFDDRAVVTFGLRLPSARYGDASRVQGFYAELLRDIEALPGVAAAGAARKRPLADPMGTWAISYEGLADTAVRPDSFPEWQVVTPGYLETLRIELVEGRAFTTTDVASSPPVAIVNRTMARSYWPDESPIGRRIRLDGGPDNPWVNVIGVVGDVRHAALDAEVPAKMYLLHSQYADISNVTAVPSMFVLVRTEREIVGLNDSLRDAVWRLDPQLPITDEATMRMIVDRSIARPQLAATVLTLLAAISLMLAGSGIYGVLASHVVRRRREIGVRMALGADGRSIRSMVLGGGLRLAGTGLLLGGVAAWAMARLISRFLYGVAPLDTVTFVIVALSVVGLATIASYLPARRAARLPPASSIGAE